MQINNSKCSKTRWRTREKDRQAWLPSHDLSAWRHSSIWTLHEYKITQITQRQSFLLVPDIPTLTFHEWKEKYCKLGIVVDAQIWLPRPPRVSILNYEWLDLKQLMNKKCGGKADNKAFHWYHCCYHSIWVCARI